MDAAGTTGVADEAAHLGWLAKATQKSAKPSRAWLALGWQRGYRWTTQGIKRAGVPTGATGVKAIYQPPHIRGSQNVVWGGAISVSPQVF